VIENWEGFLVFRSAALKIQNSDIFCLDIYENMF